jgi:hypothetical protein
MGIESGTKIKDLQSHQPYGSDQVSEGDDHIRLIKTVLTSSFPADIEKQVPDIIGHSGKHLAVAEDELSTEWVTDTEYVPPPPMAPSLFRYGKAQDQILPSRQWEKIVFDVSIGDPASWWANNSWTIPEDGVYNIAASVRIVNTSIWDHDFSIRVNGQDIKKLSYTNYTETDNIASIAIHTAFNAVAGNVVTVEAYTESSLTLGADSTGSLASLTGYRIA